MCLQQIGDEKIFLSFRETDCRSLRGPYFFWRGKEWGKKNRLGRALMTAPPKTLPTALRESVEARSEAQTTSPLPKPSRKAGLGRHFVAARCVKHLSSAERSGERGYGCSARSAKDLHTALCLGLPTHRGGPQEGHLQPFLGVFFVQSFLHEQERLVPRKATGT